MRTTARDQGNYIRTISGRVNSTGGLLQSTEPVIVTRTGTGEYTIRVANAARRILHAMATVEAATFLFATTAAAAAEGVMNVSLWVSTTGARADGFFSFTMTVSDR